MKIKTSRKAWRNLTTREERLLSKELAKRIKDLIFMGADEKATELIRELPEVVWDDEVHFDFRIDMLGGDIYQIIGRSEREKGDN